MHLSNVSDFAPPGYQLARTEYDGCTRHVFAAPGLPELACECTPTDAAAERAALEAFQAAYRPKPVESEPVVEAPAKPARRRA